MGADMRLSDRIGRRIKLHDLHVLTAVVQIGSMSKAAALLNTTQSAVSRSIAELEQTFGVRLLDRSNRGVEPTTFGQALLDGGAAVFDDLRQTVKNIECLTDPTVGEVRVGAYDPIIIGVLSAMIERVHRKYSGISIQVKPVLPSAQQCRDLRERNIDLLFGRILSQIEEDVHSEVLAADCPPFERQLWSAIYRRKPCGGERRDRDRCSRAFRPRRLHSPMGCHTANCDLSRDDQGAVRFEQGFCADQRSQHQQVCPPCQCQGAGQNSTGIRRVRPRPAQGLHLMRKAAPAASPICPWCCC
jgi:DNA-binding transcriptional LysR family regulator